MHFRATTRGKTSKTVVLPGFCGIERGGSSGGMQVMGPLLWQSCQPKIYGGGPAF